MAAGHVRRGGAACTERVELNRLEAAAVEASVEALAGMLRKQCVGCLRDDTAEAVAWAWAVEVTASAKGLVPHHRTCTVISRELLASSGRLRSTCLSWGAWQGCNRQSVL
jgi:hypothetical protein